MRGKYGPWLRLRRQEQQLSQEVLARFAELDRSYLARIERGEVMPGRDIRDRINKALNIDPQDMGYLRSLPQHERAVAQLAAEEDSLSPGQVLDRMLLFTSGRERDIILELIYSLNRLIMADDEEGGR